jgi:hypothetical protein
MFRICVCVCLLFALPIFAAEELRIWKDATGTFTIEARFVKLIDGVVQFETAAGKGMKIPLDKLAPPDAKLAQELADKAAAPPADAPAEMRTWSDASGKFKLQGKFDKLDGDTVYLLDAAEKSMKIPLSRLSPADQEYIKARPVANPFEDLGSAGKASAKAPAPGKVFAGDKAGPAKLLRPDWTKAKILLPGLAGGKWNVTIPELAAIKPLENATRIELPPRTEKSYWEKLYSLRISENKQRVMVCLHGTSSTTRLLLYDATNGKQLGQADFSQTYNVLDISDDGEQILVGGSSYNDRDFVEIWTLGPKGIIRERGWSNKRDNWDHWAEVKSAIYVDEKRALIFQAERLTLWNTVTGTPLAVMVLKRIGFGEPVYAYHPQAKLLAVQQGRELCVMEMNKGELVAALTLTDDEIPNALAWRPDAKQLALRTTLNKLLVLNAATGERVREVDLNDISIPYSSKSKLDWPTEHQVLINRGLVYDIRHGIPLWEYDGLENLEFGCGWSWTWFEGKRHDNENSSIVPLMVPHQGVRELAAKYKPPPRELLMPAGSVIALDTAEIVDPTIQQQAIAALTKQLADYGYQVSSTSENRLVASMAVGATKELVWRDFTDGKSGQELRRNFSPIICKLQLKAGDKVVWEKQSSGYPLFGNIYLNKGESIDTKIAEQEKPRYDLFLKPKIPKYKASDNDKVLGKSKLTNEGLK